MNSAAKKTIDINRIMKMIPHRYPILLVDRILEFVPGESAVGLKNVSINEPHFQGHFPDFPVMPGDSMHIHVKKVHSRANVWKFEGKAVVDGALCAEATFSAMIADKT